MTRPAPAPSADLPRHHRVFALLRHQGMRRDRTVNPPDEQKRAVQVAAFQTYAITSLRRSIPFGIGAETRGDHKFF